MHRKTQLHDHHSAKSIWHPKSTQRASMLSIELWSNTIVSFSRQYKINLHFVSRPIEVLLPFLQTAVICWLKAITSVKLKNRPTANNNLVRAVLVKFYVKLSIEKGSVVICTMEECSFLQSRYELLITCFLLCPLIIYSEIHRICSKLDCFSGSRLALKSDFVLTAKSRDNTVRSWVKSPVAFRLYCWKQWLSNVLLQNKVAW